MCIRDRTRVDDLQLSIYITSHAIRDLLADENGRREALSIFRCNGITKAYIEVYRSGLTIDKESLTEVKEFFLKNGIEVVGGIATVPGGDFGVKQEGQLLSLIHILAGNYTGVMIGYHTHSVILDGYEKGIRDFDAELAFEAMKKRVKDIGYYSNLGFIPADKVSGSVSMVMEYAYNDWSVAQMARPVSYTHLDVYKRQCSQ